MKRELENRKFDKLLVLTATDRRDGNREILWHCRCDCGNEVYVRTANLTSGNSNSCGCSRIKHGHSQNSATYGSWRAMKQRCLNPLSDNYMYYGGRGINISKRWESFENFLKDMGERPEGTSLDRINVNGNYTRGNCRWATPKEQANNRRKK